MEFCGPLLDQTQGSEFCGPILDQNYDSDLTDWDHLEHLFRDFEGF